jgi:hypothetical protein
MEQTYAVYRHFMKGSKEFIRGGLTEEEAKAHCSDPETSSSTASEPVVDGRGPWFDGYDLE